ncbi:uncharacterized protein LOC131017815 [Salvia miltiorrhiza]|uniref:uncharacterized protein LOC131017815 n=1 Tax=Salvia miltiorrhiza TaxID=226208 RepID=UPI0025AD578F|nr:uncharacterized protein LOC131017815 [Salvia miltiorrhiza]
MAAAVLIPTRLIPARPDHLSLSPAVAGQQRHRRRALPPSAEAQPPISFFSSSPSCAPNISLFPSQQSNTRARTWRKPRRHRIQDSKRPTAVRRRLLLLFRQTAEATSVSAPPEIDRKRRQVHRRRSVAGDEPPRLSFPDLDSHTKQGCQTSNQFKHRVFMCKITLQL